MAIPSPPFKVKFMNAAGQLDNAWVGYFNAVYLACRNVDTLLEHIPAVVAYSDVSAAGSKICVAAGATERYIVRGICITGEGLSFNAGGDRNLSIQSADGSLIYTIIPAATLKSIAQTEWGFGTGCPFPTTPSVRSSATVAGDDIVAKYSGGTTDYTSGSIGIYLSTERIQA